MKTSSIFLSLHLLVFLSANIALAQTPQSVKEPSYFSYGFDGTAKQLKSLFDTGDINGFLKFYNENKNELNKKSPKFDYWYYKIIQKYNSEFEKASEPLINNSDKIISNTKFPVSEWAPTKLLSHSVSSLIKDYDSFDLLRDPKFSSPKYKILNELSIALSKFIENKKDDSFKIYLSGDYQVSFFEMYPLSDSVDESQFYSEHIALLLDHASTLKYLENDYVFSKIKNKLDRQNLNNYIEIAIKFNIKEKDWNNLYSIITFLKDESISDQLIIDIFHKYVNVWIINKADSSNTDFIVKFLNLNSHKLMPMIENDYSILNTESKFTMFVTNIITKSDRKIIDKQDIKSKFLSGYHLEENSEYYQAQSRVESARYEYNEALIAKRNFDATNTGAAGFAGALTAASFGIRLGNAQGRLREAISSLGNVPRQIRVSDFSEYSYAISKIQLKKEISFTVYLFKPGDIKVNKIIIKKEFEKIFDLAYNLNSKDPDLNYINNKYKNESLIEKEEKAPIDLNFYNLMELLVTKNTIPTQASTMNLEIIASISDSDNSFRSPKKDIESRVLVDQRFSSVVIVVNPNGGLGSGFFVGPNLIVTNQHVVAGTSFPEIKLYSGESCVGKVIKTDLGLDLALVKVSKPGKPLEILADIPDSGTSVDAIGHPKGLTFTLTRGIISAVRYIPNRLVPGSRKMLVIQTDAAINPGNSGGPLLIGDKVVGVNSQKLSETGVEGLGFALHSSELQRFLSDPQ